MSGKNERKTKGTRRADRLFSTCRGLAEKCIGRVFLLGRWLLAAGVAGILIGTVASWFSRAITAVTAFRAAHVFMVALLPLGGLVIVALYRLDTYKAGTNRVLEGIQSGKHVPLRMAPLIVAGTVITHAVGGSAGREGAALQLGGSIGGTMGKWMRFDESDQKIMIMCGMSAAFSALFGTPLTAAVFAMEVISVGIMEYAALVPCAFAALVARECAVWIGAEGEHFSIPESLPFNIRNTLLVLLLGFLCAGVSIFFCRVLHETERFLKKKIPNEWIRAAAGGCAVILLAFAVQSTDYLGAGMQIIERAIDGEVVAAAFLLKIVFTAISLGSGFKGGEIVPTLFVGATFGALFGQITGFDPALAAACGMAAVFCGVTNCPISSLFLSFELFGFSCMPFFLLAISVSYLESGYYGLYHSQKILYSKTRLQFINTRTKE